MRCTMWTVMVVTLTTCKLLLQVDCSSSATYGDTLIANFLNKEHIIWEKIEKHLNPLPDIQQIASKDNLDLPLDYFYSSGVRYLLSSNNFPESYNKLEDFRHDIENCWWKENGENRTNLTSQEIDERYTKVDTLSNGLFNLTSQDFFWQFAVAKMVSAYHTQSKNVSTYTLVSFV